MAIEAEGHLLGHLEMARLHAKSAHQFLVKSAVLAEEAGLDAHKVEAIRGVAGAQKSTENNIQALMANEGGTRG